MITFEFQDNFVVGWDWMVWCEEDGWKGMLYIETGAARLWKGIWNRNKFLCRGEGTHYYHLHHIILLAKGEEKECWRHNFIL